MALLHLSTSGDRPRWRDAPEPRAVRDAAAAGVGRSAWVQQGALSRRQRFVRRGLPVVAVLVLAGLLISWVTGPNTRSPEQVSESAHEQVLRDVIRRTGDYSMTVGKLDCIEILPGRGNCLADLRSKHHRADGLLVAVAYVVDPDDGQLELVVKLP
jgi:hypothetical protein